MNCVFNDIIRLDFTKFRQMVSEYQVYKQEQDQIEQQALDERKKEQEEAEAAGNPPPTGEQ